MLFKAEVDVCVIRCLGGAPSLELSAFCVANAIFDLLMNSTFYKVGFIRKVALRTCALSDAQSLNPCARKCTVCLFMCTSTVEIKQA